MLKNVKKFTSNNLANYLRNERPELDTLSFKKKNFYHCFLQRF